MKDNQTKIIDNYKISGIIIKTPEGILYKAVDEASGNNALLKLYYPDLEWSEDLLKEFFDQMGYLRFIEHEYLLPIIDIGKQDGKPYVVFPLEAFSFLKDYALRTEAQTEGLNLFSRISEALDFLHKQEILHGSLTLENIFVDDDTKPRIFDYGLNGVFKKLLSENVDDGFTNLCISDIRCASPEQILGHNPNRGSDIYAFGMIYYFYIFGKFLFEGSTPSEIAVSQIKEDPFVLEMPTGKASYTTIKLIQKCIQADPNLRFKRFSEIQGILENMSKRRPVRLSTKNRVKFVPSARQKQRRGRWLLSLVVMFTLVFSLYYFQDRIRKVFAPEPAILTIAEEASPQQTATSAPAASQSTIEVSTPTAVSLAIPTNLSVDAEIDARPAFGSPPKNKPIEVISTNNVEHVAEYLRLGYGKPEDVDLAGDSSYFALASSSGVFIYSNNILNSWIDPMAWATSVEFSPNDDVLAIGLKSGDIQLWDWRNNLKLASLSGHSDKVSRILFSKNNSFLYSASDDQHVIVWSLKTNEIIHDIPAHSDRLNDIKLSSDGRTLVSCSDDRLVRFWDLATGKKLFEKTMTENVFAVALSPDDTYFAVGGDSGFIHQWDVKDLQIRTEAIPAAGRIWNLEYVDDDVIFAGLDGGKFARFNATKGAFNGVARFEIVPWPLSLNKIFGLGYKFDAFADFDGSVSDGNNVTINWDGQVKSHGTEILKPVYDNLDRLDLSSDGSILAASGQRGITSIWKIDTNLLLYQAEVRLPLGDPIAPDSTSVVLGEFEYRSINLESGSTINNFNGGYPEGQISFADEGNILITSFLNGSQVWDYASGNRTVFNSNPDDGCRLTYSSNDGELLQVSSTVGIFPFWDESVKRVCAKSLLYRNTLSAISGDRKLLVYLGLNKMIEAVEPMLDQPLWRYAPEDKVTVLAVSPDGALVLIGTETGKLVFIDGRTGEELKQIIGSFGSVQAIEFSEDGTKIATAGNDGTARLFGIVNSNQ
jgi:WD40 repeat protein